MSEPKASESMGRGANPGTSSALTLALGVAALVALTATVGVGLALPETVEQGQYARLIAIHPGLAWASYVAFAVTAGASGLWLWRRAPLADHVAGASAEIGVVFTALTLVTGSIWGRPTWGVWWVWDARLTLSALMLAIYLGYLALRATPAPAELRARRAAVAGVVAIAVVPLNHFAVDWWRTLHQGRSLAQIAPETALDGAYLGAMGLGFLAMTLTFTWLVVHRTRLAVLSAAGDDLDIAAAIAARRAEALSVGMST